MPISLPPQLPDTDTIAVSFLSSLIASAEPQTEEVVDEQGNITTRQTGVSVARRTLFGPNFAQFWRWAVDQVIVLNSSGNANVNFSRLDAKFDGTPISLSFNENTNTVEVRFPTPTP